MPNTNVCVTKQRNNGSPIPQRNGLGCCRAPLHRPQQYLDVLNRRNQPILNLHPPQSPPPPSASKSNSNPNTPAGFWSGRWSNGNCQRMSNTPKIGRNDPCPCGSGSKYKNCCLGKVDWQALQHEPASTQVRFLSLRGKNMSFLGVICDALQVDQLRTDPNFAKLKRAFTPKAVRKIHEALTFLWPDYDDFRRCLSRESAEVTGLYTGKYEPEDVCRAVASRLLRKSG